MPRTEILLKVVDHLNERMTDPDGPFAEYGTSGYCEWIIVGDVCLWEDQNTVIPCEICDREQHESHTCPGDTFEGLLAHCEKRLREQAEGLLALAGGPTPEPGR